MAVGDVTFSALARVSLGSISHVFSQAGSIGVSAWTFQEITVSPNVSNQSVNMGFLSNPSVVMLRSTQPVRVNFGAVGNSSYVSAASAGFAFQNLFAWCGSLASGPNAILLANSGTASAVVAVLLGQ